MVDSSLVGTLTNAVKEHSRSFGVAGAVIGAILVIYYCGSINFYPSGLTIADTLFFLWVVVVFGFYYSVIAFAFFIASIFWLMIFAKPINFILKKSNTKTDIVVSLPKSDWLIVFVGGFIANLMILGISHLKDHSFMEIFGAFLLIGCIYTLIENTSKRVNTSDKLLDPSGNPISFNSTNTQIVNIAFYILIYAAPLLFGQVGGGVTRTTFETMGVRQEAINLHIDAKEYKSTLEAYSNDGLIADLICSDVCTIKNANVLFTNVGTNTKVELYGKSGSIQLVLPTIAIKLTANPKHNKSSKANAEKRAAS
ncbi:hypothetical protein [Plesiomonas shigelloides]|uniref:hypothetical protein n=1 Tax=Plesiomonas shigelloides TaxID=703 RepID=UPI00068C7108|nr:hypothetical protein [Plesiomonas shigelloides]